MWQLITYLLLLLLNTPFAHSDNLKPSKEVERLDRFFSGLWRGELTVKHSDGHTEKSIGNTKCERVADGFGLLCATDSDPADNNVSELWLLSYEKATGNVHHFITEGESAHDHIGKWIDDNTLEISKAPVKSGCNLVSMRLRHVDQNHFELAATEADKTGGQDQFNIKFTRTSKKEFAEHAGKEKTSEVMKKLDAILLGKWSLQEHVTLGDGQEKQSHAHVSCDPVGAGFGIRCMLDWEKKTGLTQEYWLMGYDKASAKVHVFVIEGESAHDHVGILNEKDELVLSRAGCDKGPCAKENMVIKRSGNKRVLLEGSAEDDKAGTVRFRFDLERTFD